MVVNNGINFGINFGITGWWWLEPWIFLMCFPVQLGFLMIPTDEIQDFSEGFKPPTRIVRQWIIPESLAQVISGWIWLGLWMI